MLDRNVPANWEVWKCVIDSRPGVYQEATNIWSVVGHSHGEATRKC